MSDNSAANTRGDEADDSVPADSLLRYPKLRTLTLVFVLMGIMLHTIDSTIANVALPHIQGSLSATIDQISWVITGYIIAAAVATPAVAWLSARIGVRTVMLVSVIGFTLSSVLCGLAITLQDLVLYRVLQGLSGAALIPVGQAIVLSSFKPEETGKAMALFGLGVMFGPIIGPTLGGYITEWMDWRWVFFVNLPFGLLAAVGITFLIKKSPPRGDLRFDWLGFLTLVVAMASFQMMMDRGHGKDWFDSWEIICWALLALSAIYVYVVRTATATQPLFSRQLFRDRNFVVGNILFFFIGGNMVASMIMLPVIMQSLMGYPVEAAGMLLAPRGFGLMLAMALAPRLADKIDPRILVSAGIAIAAYAMWAHAKMGIYFTTWSFISAGFIHGIGLGLVFVVLGALSFAHMDSEIRLQASTFFNMVRNVGQSFCAAVTMSILAHNIQVNTSELGESIYATGDMFRLALADGVSLGNQEIGLSILQSGIMRQASLISYINNFYILALTTALLVPLVWLAKNHESPS